MNGDYNNGLKCAMFGKPTCAMSKEELIEFIGKLDFIATNRQLKINQLTDWQEKAFCAHPNIDVDIEHLGQ